MATSGLGNYKYDLTVDGGSKFHWYDPEDASNTADVTIAQKDYPEGVTDGDARQIADIAYALVAKQLDDKRDARVKREAADQLNKQLDDEATKREATADFLSNSTELSDTQSALNSTEESQDNSKKK